MRERAGASLTGQALTPALSRFAGEGETRRVKGEKRHGAGTRPSPASQEREKQGVLRERKDTEWAPGSLSLGRRGRSKAWHGSRLSGDFV